MSARRSVLLHATRSATIAPRTLAPITSQTFMMRNLLYTPDALAKASGIGSLEERLMRADDRSAARAAHQHRGVAGVGAERQRQIRPGPEGQLQILRRVAGELRIHQRHT